MPQGDFAVDSYETNDLEKSFKVLASSKEPWAARFHEHLKRAHGIDLLAGPLPTLNEKVVDWSKNA